MAALRKFNTLPAALFSSTHHGGSTSTSNQCWMQSTHETITDRSYAATVGGGAAYSNQEDEEMSSVSDSASDSGETHELECDHDHTSTTAGTSPPDAQSHKNRLKRMPSQRDLSPDQATRNHEQVVMVEQQAEDDVVVNAKLTEWESNGGLCATMAAFEGTLLLESSLHEITDWCAPIVWKMYLRQATQCTTQHRHQYIVPLDAPCPPFFAKLLTRAMPRYKGGMTRAIAITHALLYLQRIKTCFHCTTVSSAPTFTQQTLKQGQLDERGQPLSAEHVRAALTNVAAQCSLFFAVGMHYASLWLLDCCPSENTYWKRYVHCVQAAHGIAWSRLVLQHWSYQINTSVEEWLSFSSQLISKFPYVDDEKRSRLASATTIVA